MGDDEIGDRPFRSHSLDMGGGGERCVRICGSCNQSLRSCESNGEGVSQRWRSRGRQDGERTMI
jgi:hypothetical protein